MRSKEQQDAVHDRLGIMGHRVPSFHSPDHFNIEKYIEKDNSREKADADLIRTGNFRELIRRNHERGNSV